MTSDASDLLLPHVRQFTIGLALTDPPHPKVLGTGVLVSIGNLNGILTCCHVADEYEKQSEIGLVRFSRDGILQRQKLVLATTNTLKIGGPPWGDPYAFDLAFTRLAEPDVAALKATSVILNYQRNWKKFADGEPNHNKHVDALRDRALIGLMVYSFARVGAAIGMRVEDMYTQNRRLWVRLHEKGGKQHAMPCHYNLETYLHEYINGTGLATDPKALLFQTYSRAAGQLSGNPLPQANAYAMIQRRARTADITTKIGNHTFRATGITAYLKNGGTLEKAAAMANHASTRTTQLYDRRGDKITLDEVERVVI